VNNDNNAANSLLLIKMNNYERNPPKSHTISMSKLFELCHYTVGYTWDACRNICSTTLEEEERQQDGHLAYKQSIIPDINSNLFCKLKLIKFVSMSTRYGGTRAVL